MHRGDGLLLGAAGRIPGDWRNITRAGLKEASKEGFSVLNLVVTDPDGVSEAEVERLKGMFEEAHILIGQTNGAYGGALASPDDRVRASAVEFAKRMCGLTRPPRSAQYLPQAGEPEFPWCLAASPGKQVPGGVRSSGGRRPPDLCCGSG